ncbi:hypothetical protein BGZ94_005823 [Podila epigama]|nr:hypothetical protein BGZ94_005823 [Podila epigama]
MSDNKQFSSHQLYNSNSNSNNIHYHSSPNHRPKDEESGLSKVYGANYVPPSSNASLSNTQSMASNISSTRQGSTSPVFDQRDSSERWSQLRLRVMRMATVKRLQWLWGLLTLFGAMAWLALLPAIAFSIQGYAKG